MQCVGIAFASNLMLSPQISEVTACDGSERRVARHRGFERWRRAGSPRLRSLGAGGALASLSQ